jgi:hypothetical protein
MSKNMKVIQPVIDGGPLTRGVSENVSTGPDTKLKKKLEEFRKRVEKGQSAKANKPTGGGKRQQKPPMTRSTEWLVKALTFLSLDAGKATNGELLLETYRLVGYEDLSKKDIEKSWGNYQYNHVRETLQYSQRAIDISLNEDRDTVRRPYEYRFKEGVKISDWLMAAIKPIYFESLLWSGKQHCQFFEVISASVKEPAINLIYSLRAKMARCILESFAWTKITLIDGQSPVEFPNGGYYIGACPRCGRIFERKRQNQFYDRDTCRNKMATK